MCQGYRELGFRRGAGKKDLIENDWEKARHNCCCLLQILYGLLSGAGPWGTLLSHSLGLLSSPRDQSLDVLSRVPCAATGLAPGSSATAVLSHLLKPVACLHSVMFGQRRYSTSLAASQCTEALCVHTWIPWHLSYALTCLQVRRKLGKLLMTWQRSSLETQEGSEVPSPSWLLLWMCPAAWDG